MPPAKKTYVNEDKHGEIYRLAYNEYKDYATAQYHSYKNTSLIDYYAQVFAHAYEKKRGEGCSVHESNEYAKGYASTYGEGLCKGEADATIMFLEHYATDPEIREKMSVQKLAERFNLPEAEVTEALDAYKEYKAGKDE